MAGLPDLLTVEEAAGVLRIGRTKAYAMAREWRDTGGRSGLPIVDLGHVLRVPLRQLETLVGGPFTAHGVDVDQGAAAAALEPPQVADPEPPAAPRRPSRRRTSAPGQPTLPFAS